MSIYSRKKSYSALILAAALWAASIRMAEAAQSKIGQIIVNAIGLVRSTVVLVWVIALVVFGWGIVRLIAASSNQEELKKAKGFLWWGIIGMFVLASIIGIIYFLQEDFDIPGGGVIIPPQFGK